MDSTNRKCGDSLPPSGIYMAQVRAPWKIAGIHSLVSALHDLSGTGTQPHTHTHT